MTDDTYHYQCHCHGNVEFILLLQRRGLTCINISVIVMVTLHLYCCCGGGEGGGGGVKSRKIGGGSGGGSGGSGGILIKPASIDLATG